MSTTKEKAKFAKIAEIIFTIVELSYCVWVVYFFWDYASNKTIFSFLHFYKGKGPKTAKERERDIYNEERDLESMIAARKVIATVLMIVIFVEIGLEVFAINRLSKAVEMSESNPKETMELVVCYTKIQNGILSVYAFTIVLFPAALIRAICVGTAGSFMEKLGKEMQTRNQDVPGASPVFGQGQDGVIGTHPQSNTASSSILPASSSDFSQIKTV